MPPRTRRPNAPRDTRPPNIRGAKPSPVLKTEPVNRPHPEDVSGSTGVGLPQARSMDSPSIKREAIRTGVFAAKAGSLAVAASIGAGAIQSSLEGASSFVKAGEEAKAKERTATKLAEQGVLTPELLAALFPKQTGGAGEVFGLPSGVFLLGLGLLAVGAIVVLPRL